MVFLRLEGMHYYEWLRWPRVQGRKKVHIGTGSSIGFLCACTLE